MGGKKGGKKKGGKKKKKEVNLLVTWTRRLIYENGLLIA